MSEIDLFPDDLRRKLRVNRWFKLTGFALLAMTVLWLSVFVMLRQANAHFAAEIEYFQEQREISDANRQRLQQLNQQKADLRQQLDLLRGLRSGASAEHMFMMLDRALPGPEVWLTRWRFRRAGAPVESDSEVVDTGYFIVVPAGKDASQAETWKIETHMSIQGQARDHVAMSKFVLNLIQQPEIDDVRIVNSRLDQSNRAKLVDFSLDIVVNAGRGKS